MNRMASRISTITASCCFGITLAVAVGYAQSDSVEFKLIPRYNPEKDVEFTTVPAPEVTFKPEILYPHEPGLKGKEAKVVVIVSVNREGIVEKAEILRTTDKAFNKYAIRYAKEYRFRWKDGWPTDLKDRKNVSLAISIPFKK